MTLRADIATGETTLDRIDLRLEGALPLVLARRYRSGAPGGIFGLGWEYGLDRTLHVEPDRVVYREGSGRETIFAPIPVGMEARHPEGLTLQRHADGYVVFASPLVQDVFRNGSGGAPLPLERIVDPNGNRVKLSYAGGRLAEITASGGQRVRFAYSGGVVAQIAVGGADGRVAPVRTFRYGVGGTLVAETDAAGRTTEYAYQSGLLVRVGSGHAAWLAQYDAGRRCLALWRADGTAVTHLAYDALRQTTRATGLDGRQVVYRHALGTAGSVVLEREDAAGEGLHYYYDEAQRLIGFDDPGGTVVTFQRLDPAKGELFQIDGERRFLTTTLTAAGLVATVEGDDGAFAVDYDERFNPVRLTTPLGAAWAFERDAKGRTTAILSPAGRRVTLRRDGATLTVEGPGGLCFRLTMDGQGRTATRRDASGREIRFRHDVEGRLTEAEGADGYRVAWERDAAGRLVRIADSERGDVRWTRDGAGRVLAIETGGETVRFEYDLAGRINAVKGKAREVRLAYDEQDRLRHVRGPGWMTFGYDEGQTAVRMKAWRRVFSANGDLVEEQEGETTRRFRYGATGELRSVEEETGGEETLLRLDYDGDGRLTQVDRGAAVFLGYDPDGLLTSVGGDDETRSFRLDYDDRLRPVTLHRGDAVWHLAFDPAGRLTAVEGEGGRVTLRYDGLDRCVAYQAGEASEVLVTGEDVARADAGEGLAVVVARRGVALIGTVGGEAVPLWARDELRRRSIPLTARVVRSLVRGPEAALVSAWERPGPPDDGWPLLASAEAFTAAVPRASALGLPWPTLDLFMLARYDPHEPRRRPGSLPYDQQDGARAPDGLLTGTHRRGRLHPAAWPERAHGAHLEGTTFARGDDPASLAYRLYQTLPRP